MIESQTTTKVSTLLARATIRAYKVTAAAVGRILYRQNVITSLPQLQHAEAEQIGLALHDHWLRLIGDKVPDREDLAWADIVQFVARQSGKTD